MYKRFFQCLLLIFPTITFGADFAGAPGVVGIIDAVDTSGTFISIDANTYYLTARTEVKRFDGKAGSMTELAKGERVACRFVVGDDGRRYLLTARIIPKGAKLELRPRPGFPVGDPPG